MFRNPLKRLFAGGIVAVLSALATAYCAQNYHWKIDPQQLPMIQVAVGLLFFCVVWFEAGEGLDFLENDNSIPVDKSPLTIPSIARSTAVPTIPQLGLARLTGEEQAAKPGQQAAATNNTTPPPTIKTAENTRITGNPDDAAGGETDNKTN